MIWFLFIFPVLLAFLSSFRRKSRLYTAILLAGGALPALYVAAGPVSVDPVAIPGLLLDVQFGLDTPRRVFLLLTALLWAVAGVFAGGYLSRDDPHMGRFRFFFLIAMAGNLGLIVAEDLPSFYTLFVLMTFASYGLVIHTATPSALWAGRVYLVMAILGELFLITAVYAVVEGAGTILLAEIGPALVELEHRGLILFLAFVGFGVKAGAVPLYFWLPLAHPVAPTPASAVLSGAMIKAGLLGWLHFSPADGAAFPVWGSAVIVLGFLAVFGAVILGLFQTDPKTNLAYSSISQMGVMTVLLGVGLGVAGQWDAVAAAIALYAWNHGIAKGALFLGTGVAAAATAKKARIWVLAGLALPAAAVAGAPLTGGAIAKYGLKGFAETAPEPWSAHLGWLIALSSLATSLLLTRFLWLAWRKMGSVKQESLLPLTLPWCALLMVVAVGTHLVNPGLGLGLAVPGVDPATLFEAAWPLALGGILVMAVARRRAYRVEDKPMIPPGDLIVLITKILRAVGSRWIHVGMTRPALWSINLVNLSDRLMAIEEKNAIVEETEIRLGTWNVVGALFILFAIGFIVLLL